MEITPGEPSIVSSSEKPSYAQLEEKVRQLETENAQLLSSAETDYLLQISNRRGFTKNVEREIAKTARGEQTLAFAIFDLDRFKQINDTYGHLQGDTVLRQFAEVLQSSCRTEDLCGRWGGEEFAFSLSFPGNFSEDQVLEVFNRIRQKALTISRSGVAGQDPLTVSVGCLVVERGTAVTLDEITQLADQNLYLSKNEGRDRVTLSRFSDKSPSKNPALKLSETGS